MAYPTGAKPLDAGDAFPSLSFATADGTTVTLPIPGEWTILTIYRGVW